MLGILVAAASLLAQGTVIEGASVLDGLGALSRFTSVRIEAGRVTAVGDHLAQAGDRVIDAKGLVLAPGFIDIHNHSDRGLAADPNAVTQISQGITTLVVGVDGGSALPIGAWVRNHRPASVNIATFVGHATVRQAVMGNGYRRRATPAEVEKMASLVEQATKDGAFGLSTGLEYEVGSYASTEEVIALAKATGRQHGIYVSHIRDESELAFDSFREIIRIGEESKTPVHISHIKLGSKGVWGKAEQAVALIERARAKGLDITADLYPYDAWSSGLSTVVTNKKYSDPASIQEGFDIMGGPQNVTIINCAKHPDYEFKDLAQIAKMTHSTPVQVFLTILRDGGASVVGHAMKEPDIREFFIQPWVMVASDGGIGMRHPRSAGTFPRVLGKYVREDHWTSLAEGVRKMTSLPAARLGLADRGVIRPGAVADLVLFDADHVQDQATFEEPARLAVGIRQVYVSGELVWGQGAATGKRPGKVLTRAN